jgi:hypothetical protein
MKMIVMMMVVTVRVLLRVLVRVLLLKEAVLLALEIRIPRKLKRGRRGIRGRIIRGRVMMKIRWTE